MRGSSGLTRGGGADHHCKMEGAEGLAYPPIVASGADACTIHYSRNDKVRPALGDLGRSPPVGPCQVLIVDLANLLQRFPPPYRGMRCDVGIATQQR